MVNIIYQDEHIVAINKPSGLLSIPDGYAPYLPNLQSILKDEFGSVWTVHRLDKETSGVILFTLSATAHKEMSALFELRKIKKNYRALVLGVNLDTHFVVDIPLRVNGDRRHRTVIDPVKGKPAQTEFYTQKQLDQTSIIDAFPLSGYTHQIRAHLAYHETPIVNDSLYGNRLTSPPTLNQTGRLMLHAIKISFVHPFTQIPVEIVAPLPPELAILDV